MEVVEAVEVQVALVAEAVVDVVVPWLVVAEIEGELVLVDATEVVDTTAVVDVEGLAEVVAEVCALVVAVVDEVGVVELEVFDAVVEGELEEPLVAT